jgi:hypothetical protein
MCLKSGMLPPYLGSTIRGIMGHCFRQIACTGPDVKCFLCQKRDTCEYVKYFSNTGKEGGAINPYVIHVLNDGKSEWHEGDECVFDITLFGQAVKRADIYFAVIIAMEQKGWGVARLPFRLIRISDVKTEKLLYVKARSQIGIVTDHQINWNEKEAGIVLLSFDTPLRIITGKKLCLVPSFAVLIQFIMRRLSLLLQVHTEYKLEWDEEALLDLAKQIRIVDYQLREVDFERYSINQKSNKLELPAISGWILYEGNLTKLTPILEAGKILHIGKGSTIGFGHYELFLSGGNENEKI